MDNATERRTIAPVLGPDGMRSAPSELIPGYELIERIGAGGFGEVWRATAPGGLEKAVKIVYGTMSDRHATAELKSLERIKTVRHPFIITLERIEIANGRLVVVCELAERSLRDYFDELLTNGHSGIERNKLIGYLHDVADALDYMSEQHSLQHLDIKPENLLLLSDHVKVADFGLTKDLRDASLSAVAGMTPAYTAPEVFSGNPGRHSDQYSLACVYQLLLTGRPPFTGRSTAELLSQHLHSPANVSLLPAHDQSVVLKALSKNPSRRYGSAREFVEALKEAGKVKDRPASKQKSASRTPSSSAETIPRRDTDTTTAEEVVLKVLGPLAGKEIQPTLRPTLVIGLGGMAGSVLQSLKGELAQRFPDDAAPAFRLLAIDTDETALLKRMYEAKTGGLSRLECLPVALKPSSAYQRRFKNLTEWISRRWLFNIPRSQRTEGIRALGRLAFVDHYREIDRAIRDTIQDMSTPDALNRTAAVTGFKNRSTAPRVMVITSTSGGAGSGMVFDTGYAVRSILRDRNLPDEGVTGIFLHDTRTADIRGEIFTANAMSCIRELSYYCRTQQYSGDSSYGIPPMEMVRPFETAYIVPIGRPIGGSAALGSIDVFAEYLFQSFAGPSCGALDHLRAKANPGGLMPKVKSFAAALLAAPQQPAEILPELFDAPDLEPVRETESFETAANARQPVESADPDFDPFVTIPATITPQSMDAEFDRINSLLQDAGTGSPTNDEAAAPEPATEAIHIAHKPPGQYTVTDDIGFSASALFAQLQKTRGNVRMILAGDNDSVQNLDAGVDGPWKGNYTTIADSRETTFACFEVDGIPICDIMAILERDAPQCAEMADQLATRIDINWVN